jgi:hypothetical protein
MNYFFDLEESGVMSNLDFLQFIQTCTLMLEYGLEI